MKVLLSWLQEFFSETFRAQEVADALYRVGIEVEHIEEMGQELDGVVVARIDETKPHPNADKLTLCKVFDGKKTLDIVCGASNFKTGDHVALATVGTKLPGEFVIQKSKIRGEFSHGMLCSNEELGFAPSTTDGILILESTTEPGTPLKQALGLQDAVLHLSLTPNRGDCFSVLGIAIELAAALNLKIKPPTKSMATFQSIPMVVEIMDTVACSKYTLHRIEGVTVKPSTALIAQRLEKCGIRPINNIVDVTNYMMLERGQPMHAFDADRVRGKIQVRKAIDGEKIKCLDDVIRNLTADDLVIADEDGPIGIAGVMGGMNSAITDQTKNVFLESAIFDPKTIRTTSRRLNLVSESSKRFEREVDPSNVLSNAMVAANMVDVHSSGKTLGGVDFDHLKLKPIKIHVTQENIQKILGVEVPNAGEYLSRLGFSLEKMGDGWTVEVPLRRPEIQRDIDLIEEIARIYGYDNIPSKLPNLNVEPKVDSLFAQVELLRQKITAQGLQEVRTYSFTSLASAKIFSDSDVIEVENPLTPDAAMMRTSILPGLLETWKVNYSRQCEGLRLFEIGKTFSLQGQNVRETLKLAAIWAGHVDSKLWYRQNDRVANYYDGKGFLENLLKQYRVPSYSLSSENTPAFLHPGQSVGVVMAKKNMGWMGMLHPSVCRQMDLEGPICVLEMELPLLLEMGNRKPKFEAYSPYPKIERDLALVMKKNVKYADVLAEIQSLKIPFMTQAFVFDRFEGGSIPKDSVSQAYRFVFQSLDKTLTDQDVEDSLNKVSEHLKAKFEASVRS